MGFLLDEWLPTRMTCSPTGSLQHVSELSCSSTETRASGITPWDNDLVIVTKDADLRLRDYHARLAAVADNRNKACDRQDRECVPQSCREYFLTSRWQCKRIHPCMRTNSRSNNRRITDAWCINQPRPIVLSEFLEPLCSQMSGRVALFDCLMLDYRKKET